MSGAALRAHPGGAFNDASPPARAAALAGRRRSGMLDRPQPVLWSLSVIAVRILASVALAYLLGSIPFGVWLCRLRGKDPRVVGSGRTGGTNVYRTAGLPTAILTIGCDLLKGYLAVLAAEWLVPATTYGGAVGWAMALAALSVIIGHNYSLFLGFRGGAGSTPNFGASLAFDPIVSVIGLAGAALGLFAIRVASIASLILSTVLLLGLGWRSLDGSLPPATLVYAVGQMVIVVWALRPNIQRLRDGTERRITFGRRAIREGTDGA